jgi:2-polyprenyl-3-methyl-5-hydroxy-6-metoxy-1,4-benzoquinol methylase
MPQPLFADLEKNLKPYLPSSLTARILDVGCGHGRVLQYLAAQGFVAVHGIDRDEKALTHAKKLRASLFISHVPDWDAYFNLAHRNFDFIIAKDMLYYFPPEELVKRLVQLRNALKPGGMLWVETFNGATFTGPFVQYKDYQIRWIPTEQSLVEVLEKAGFTQVVVKKALPASHGVAKKLFNGLQFLWQQVLRTIYFLERGLDPNNPKILTPRIIATAVRPLNDAR